MKAIDFVVRTVAGATQYGSISAQDSVSTVETGQGQEVSLNLRQSDVAGYSRSGQDLLITLADGRVVVLADYFDGEGTRLFISADGFLNEVALSEDADGTLYAQYGPTEQWGKWSPADDLIFLADSELGDPLAEDDGDTVSMLGMGLIGGTGLLGAAGAGAAAIAATQLLGDTSGTARIPPSVDQSGQISVGGDGAGPDASQIVISGTAQPGSTVEVTIGDQTQTATAGSDGAWEVVFEGDSFPSDGNHDVVVVVTEPDGTRTELDGPGVVIDTTPPDTLVSDGTVSAGDVTNAADFQDGVEISGQGEPGSGIAVTVNDITRETTVDANGDWEVVFEPGTLPEGEYEVDVTIVATDAAGNTSTITDKIAIDTVPNALTIDTTTIEGDGVVNGSERADGIELTGTATPGSTVIVGLEGQEMTVVAGADGTWSAGFSANTLPDGQYEATITARSTDAAGNASSTSGTILVDTSVENFAVTSQPGGADGVINAAEAGEGLVVTGTTEPGSAVSVRLGGQTLQATVAADGSWQAAFSAAQIPAGTYSADLVATATDAAGNVRSITDTVDVDTEAGVLTLNAGSIGGDGTINAAEAARGVLVTGTADPGAAVTVELGGVPHMAIAAADGVWKTTYDSHEITPGVHDPEVRASVTDAAGNSRSVAADVHVDTQVDNLNLLRPNIATGTDGGDVINSFVAASGFDVTGTVEPGSTVTVTIGGVARQAAVNGNGDWTARFLPGDVQAGEYNADLRVDVTDPAGNTSSLSDQVRVDTGVNTLNRSPAPVETDNVINAAEARDGVILTGQVERGSTVEVDVFGKTYVATVAASGSWTLTIPGADIPEAAQDFPMVVRATDAAGNPASFNDSLTVDTLVPDQPDIVGYFREGGGYRSATVETADDAITIHQVAGSGAVSQMALHASADPFLGETDYHFLDTAGAPVKIPDGSQLVVTATDAAGNAASTYVVLDETSTSLVDIANPNLAGFEIETVDLRFGDQSRLTVTEAQVRALSDVSDTLVVHGGADDTVTIAGAQTQGRVGINGESHTIYTLGDSATVIVDDDINVIA